MWILNGTLNAIADWLLWPCSAVSPWLGLVVICLAAAGILVTLFHFSSDQQSLRRARNRFIARILELLLFQHDFRVNLSACGRILWANLGYLKAMLLPVLAATMPLILIFIQLACWFEYRPLRIGETAVLEIALDSAYPVAQTVVDVTLPAIARIDSPVVRILTTNEQAWRIRAISQGVAPIEVRVGSQTEQKQLSVSDQLARVSPVRVQSNLWNDVLSPSETPLARTVPIKRIEIHYPERKLFFMSTEIHWTIAAVLLMMTFGLILGRLFGVQVA